MTLRVFVGVDERQPIAYSVAQHSIWKHASKPVQIMPLKLETLPITRRGLTTFTYSRYLVPWLCSYQGHALFVDADILVRGDLAELPWAADEAVSVVPHTFVKKRGEIVSTMFERNAVMLFNCAKCEVLTPEFIEKQSPNKLDSWASSIGSLPKEWNHLVGYDEPNPAAKLVHFTMGIPCFPETREDEFAAEWTAAHKNLNATVPWSEIMGTSVHARWKK